MIYKKDEFIKYIKGHLQNTKVLYDKNNIVIIRVKTYGDCKTLFGNDRTINWCIANSKCHWDEYIGDHPFAKQYFIIDFDHVNDSPMIEGYRNREYVYSMIGFTTKLLACNLVAAHARNDTNLLDTYNGKELIFERVIKEKGIYKFIRNGFKDFGFLDDNFVSVLVLGLITAYSLVVWFFKWN